MCKHFYRENVFLSGLILNIISSIIIVILIALCGIQYQYININFTKLNSYQNICNLQLSLCIIYVFCCILGFIVFIKHLECKTMEKIYIIYGILSWIYSIVVYIICFLSYPNIIKNNSDLNCQLIELKGILKNFNKVENILYQTNNYLCSNDCPCPGNQKMNFQKCPVNIINNGFKEGLLNYIGSEFEQKFNSEKFMSYWSKIENKFKCVGFCNISYYSSDINNYKNINKFLFSDNRNEIKNNGCLFSLSDWLNKMILSFSCLTLINIVLSVICIYICFAILFDKVFEGSNFPQSSVSYNKKKYGWNNKQKDNIKNENGDNSKDKTNEYKITNDK